MSNPTIDRAMAHHWMKVVEQCQDGGFRLTVVPQLRDFEVFAETVDELEGIWRDALRSHLIGYIASGKVIPIPHVRVAQQSGGPMVQTRGMTGGVQSFDLPAKDSMLAGC